MAAGSLLVVATDVVQAANDKQRGRSLLRPELEPMVRKLAALPKTLGEPETLLADNGYFSATNVAACTAVGIELRAKEASPALIALGRQSHHPSLSERFAAAPPAPQRPTPVEAMAHRLATSEGKRLYGLRKHTPEPVFGIIKSVLGFRQFLLRGLDKSLPRRRPGSAASGAW